MTSQFKEGQLNACSDLDELAATRSEREQLRARVALLESNYADLRQAARDEIELKEQEIEKLRTLKQSIIAKLTGRIYRIFRRVIGKLISLLRRIAGRLPFARSVRQVLQFSRWPASIEPPQKISEIVANWRGYRAEQSASPKPSRQNSHLAAANDEPSADPLINLRGRSSKEKEGPTLLLVLPATVIGGAERLLSAVVAYLAKEGWRVTVLTTDDPGDNGDSTSWFERTTTEIFHLPRLLPEKHWRDFIANLIAFHGIEVIWIVGSAFLYNLLPIIRTSFPNIRVVDILFNTVGHTQNNRKFAKLIDLNFVESNEVLQFLVNAGESRDRILQVSSGIDLQEYEPGPREASVVNLLNVAQDELIVGFSGRWSPEKDPLMFVEIARRLSHRPIHFVMTGIGPLRPSIEAAIATGKLGHRFHLVGEVSDVRPWIRSYDVLVLPSQLDGRPVVVLEALASGVPVIASAVGGLPEVVDDGVNGFLCVPGLAAHFAGKIAKLALDRELLVRMKKAARLSAEQTLDSRKMFSSYERALRDLARPEKQPVPRS
jgi:glycosyltransferase involved in cell wall biosynthesis